MNILITGARGLLGKNLVRLLCDSKTQLFFVLRNPDKELSSMGEAIHLDLNKPNFSKHLPSQADVIIHLAQSSEYKNFPLGAMNVFNTNLLSTQELLDYGRRAGVKKFLYASSGGIYNSNKFRFNESSQLQPPSSIDHYLSTKFGSELLVQSYRNHFTHVIFRYFFIYGKNQNRLMLLPRLYDQVQRGIPIKISGKEGIKINPVHVSDAAFLTKEAIKLTASSTFNVAGPQILSMKQIVELFGKDCSRKPIFEETNAKQTNLIANIKLISGVLGSPKILIRDSIDDIRS